MFGAIALGGYSLVQIAIAIVVIAAVFALVTIALRQFGVGIPPWVIQVFWVIAVAIVIIVAIRIVSGL